MASRAIALKREGHQHPAITLLDIAEAYRHMALNHLDYGSVGFESSTGKLMYEAYLMFGVLIGCRLFSALSNTLSWLLEHAFECPN